MNKGDFEKIINKYLNGKASKQEAEKFESIYDSVQKPGKDWDDLNLSDKEKIKDEIYKNVLSRISPPGKSIIKRIHPIIKVAASIVILISIGLGVFRMSDNTNVQTKSQFITERADFGERKTIVLEDSTKIILNAGSQISYHKPFQKGSRSITLMGEAFFNVSKDKQRSFIVTTDNITTTVLGTSFNISAYNEEDITVTVSTGKVKVAYNPTDGSVSKTAILLPGQQAAFSLNKQELSKYTVDIQQFINWKENIISFNQDYFSDIIKKLERNFNVNINCRDTALLEKTITSVYENATLEEILEDLRFILGFEYSYEPGNDISITNF